MAAASLAMGAGEEPTREIPDVEVCANGTLMFFVGTRALAPGLPVSLVISPFPPLGRLAVLRPQGGAYQCKLRLGT